MILLEIIALLMIGISGILSPAYDQIYSFEAAGKLSAIAYCSLDKISNWTCNYCRDPLMHNIKSVVSFNDSQTGVQGYIGVLNKAIVLAFRGTSNYENRKNILKFFTTKTFPQVPLVTTPFTHQGFSSSYDAVKPLVQRLVLDYAIKYPIYDIVFVGHSLGGAIATLAALDTVSPFGYLSYLRNSSQIHLYTMGSPRIGNKILAIAVSEIGINVYRSVNYSDPVPHLPFNSLGYLHFPREVYIDKEGKVGICSKWDGEDRNCSNGLHILPIVAKSLKYHGVYYGTRMGRTHCF